MDFEENTLKQKQCNKCLQVKEVRFFSKSAAHKSGFAYRCKACDKAYYEQNKHIILPASLNKYHESQKLRRLEKKRYLEDRLSSPVKRCARCKTDKDKNEFGKDSTRSDLLRAYCRNCHNETTRISVKRNGRNKKSDSWRKKNPDRSREIARRHNSQVHNRIHHSISARIYAAVKGKCGKRTKEILGYSIDELMQHLERQFLSRMTWVNYGEWHIDHIRPLSSFRIESIDDPQIKIVWGLANLRPLWSEENRRKNAKMLYLL